MGRLSWSGLIAELDEARLREMFLAEELYERVSHIIKRGNSNIYLTAPVSFYTPEGTQAVVRYSEDGSEALVVAHSFNAAAPLEIELEGSFKLKESLYSGGMTLDGTRLTITPTTDFSGNVFYLFKE